MLIIFCYKGNMAKNILRDDIVDRYNKLIGTATYVRLYYQDNIPYMTDNKHVSITHTTINTRDRIELVAIGDRPVGIDIEKVDRHVNLALSHRYFSQAEQNYISDDEYRLVEVWQKREAKGKYFNMGFYKDNVLDDGMFREYDIYKGYRVVVYSEEKDVFFVAI